MEMIRVVSPFFCQGATIKRHEITGDIMVARVISGGLADRSGKSHLKHKRKETTFLVQLQGLFFSVELLGIHMV